MQTKLTLKPGQVGAKKLTALYGDKLVCVRYRYDLEKKRRFKTVEIIVEDTEWIPNKEVMLVKIVRGEDEMALKVKSAGGTWNKVKQAWELVYEKVVELGLEERIVREWKKEKDL